MMPTGSVSVLAVTSDLIFRSKIETALRSAGIPVTFTAAAHLAEAALETRPSVILLDYADCGVPGFASVVRIKEDSRTLAIPVLAFGPHLDLEARDRAKAAGADEILANSQVASDLPALVRKWSQTGIVEKGS